MNLRQARQIVRQYARNAGDSNVYTDAQIDTAIQTTCDIFILRTKCTKTESDLELEAGDSEVDFGSLENFRAERVIRAYIDGENQSIEIGGDYNVELSLVGHTAILDNRDRRQLGSATRTGTPTELGFTDFTTGFVYPIPDLAYVLTVLWSEPLTTFTAGSQGAHSTATAYKKGDIVSFAGAAYECIAAHSNQTPPNASFWFSLGAVTVATPTTVTLNIPDDYLRQVLIYGATSMLQHTEPEQAFASGSWQRLESLMQQIAGVGNLGSKITFARRRF